MAIDRRYVYRPLTAGPQFNAQLNETLRDIDSDIRALASASGSGGGGGGGTTVNAGTATLDFGSSPATEASVTVTGQSSITSSSRVKAWVMGKSTATNTVSDHQFAAVALRFSVSQPTSGIGFTITAYCVVGEVSGQFNIEWEWV